MPAKPKPKPRPAPRPSGGGGISMPTLKGGGAIGLPRPPQAPQVSPWTDPVYRLGLGGAGLTGGLGGSAGLPWWAQPPAGTGGEDDTPQFGPALDVVSSGGHGEYGPALAGPDRSRPDAGPDFNWTGGNPFGGRSPYATDVNAQTFGRLVSAGTPIPAGLASRLAQWYADRHGDNDPYDTANPGNTGPVYYGPTRHPGVGGDFAYGDQLADDWSQESGNWWNIANPGLWGGGFGGGFGGSGSGIGGGVGGGGGRDPYAGTASPWEWGGPGLR